MTNIEKFIRDAIEGGYGAPYVYHFDTENMELVHLKDEVKYSISFWRVLWVPALWRAVGKVRGWHRGIVLSYSGWIKDEEGNTTEELEEAISVNEGEYYMHRLIDALAEADAKGQSQQEAIEEYLGTI